MYVFSFNDPLGLFLITGVMNTLHRLYSNCESRERCIRDINSWMQGMKHEMNNPKTEYILFGTPQQLAKCTNTAINIGGYEVHALNVGQPMRNYITLEKSENI